MTLLEKMSPQIPLRVWKASKWGGGQALKLSEGGVQCVSGKTCYGSGWIDQGTTSILSVCRLLLIRGKILIKLPVFYVREEPGNSYEPKNFFTFSLCTSC